MRFWKASAAAAAVILCAAAVRVGHATPTPGVIDIRNDRGGVVIDYALRVLNLKKSGGIVRVSGRCMSACTLFLALPAHQICITEDAAFGFHLPYGASKTGNRTARDYLYASYPAWVRLWLEGQGGLSRNMKLMNYRFAKRFMKVCPDTAGISRDLAKQAKRSAGGNTIY